MHAGKKIKELREVQRMTLTELAQKSGVQLATLSRIENVKMTGTLDSHINIAKALGIDITQLYRDIMTEEEHTTAITHTPAKKNQGIPLQKMTEAQAGTPGTETFTYNDKASYEILTGNVLSKKMMPIVLRIEEGGRTNPEQNHPGSERFIFVLKGNITAHVAYNTYPLSPNNTLYFDASLRHYFINTGKGAAKAISLVTPVSL